MLGCTGGRSTRCRAWLLLATRNPLFENHHFLHSTIAAIWLRIHTLFEESKLYRLIITSRFQKVSCQFIYLLSIYRNKRYIMSFSRILHFYFIKYSGWMFLHMCRNNDTVRDIVCFVMRATLVPHDDSAALVTVSPVLHIATPHVTNDPTTPCALFRLCATKIVAHFI